MEHNKGNSKTEVESGITKRASHMYEPASIWEHLLYGVGGIVVMGGPLLIPGLTIKDWAVGFFGGVIGIYIIICLLGVWKNIKIDGRSQR